MSSEIGGFDIVWTKLKHISVYQFALVCGVSLLAIPAGLWTLWGVFGFYNPEKYRCETELDTNSQLLTFDEIGRLLGDPDDASCKAYTINATLFNECFSQSG